MEEKDKEWVKDKIFKMQEILEEHFGRDIKNLEEYLGFVDIGFDSPVFCRPEISILQKIDKLNEDIKNLQLELKRTWGALELLGIRLVKEKKENGIQEGKTNSKNA